MHWCSPFQQVRPKHIPKPRITYPTNRDLCEHSKYFRGSTRSGDIDGGCQFWSVDGVKVDKLSSYVRSDIIPVWPNHATRECKSHQ
ncbi:unnamed protein product [Rhizoctonia solani]|nr:unnamed protein product [Rhizoctonia solani]